MSNTKIEQNIFNYKDSSEEEIENDNSNNDDDSEIEYFFNSKLSPSLTKKPTNIYYTKSVYLPTNKHNFYKYFISEVINELKPDFKDKILLCTKFTHFEKLE